MRREHDGFSIAELITVVALIGILAAVALPVARIGFQRQKEIELRARLRKISEAIDRYHDLRQAGAIQDPPRIGQGDYPGSLDDLVKGVDLVPIYGKRVHFLRQRDLIDPMTGKNDWLTLSDSDDPDTKSSNGSNVFEVHSRSSQLALDGKTHYNEW
ncbi:MAG TPA: prepilin-type N-terminal cleavage/methylation domain-containing protein [Thermoanaerobaculia bacterium]